MRGNLKESFKRSIIKNEQVLLLKKVTEVNNPPGTWLFSWGMFYFKSSFWTKYVMTL